MISEDEIEDVARAIYASEYNSSGWDQEPHTFKERFLLEARLAIAALDRLRTISADREPQHWSGRNCRLLRDREPEPLCD